MGFTTFYGWPYPDPESPVNVPADIKALADKLELLKNGYAVPGGIIESGDPAVATGGNRGFRVVGKSGAATVVKGSLTALGDAAMITLFHDATEKNRLTLSSNGAINVRLTGIERPLAFATAAGNVPMATNGVTVATALVSFPTDRFTQAPLVVATLSTASAAAATTYSPRVHTTSATGCTVVMNSTQAWTSSFGLNWIAMQMTPGASGGLLAVVRDSDEPVYELAVTCETPGCGNEGDRLVVNTIDPDIYVVCGVCGQQITNIEQLAEETTS